MNFEGDHFLAPYLKTCDNGGTADFAIHHKFLTGSTA